MIRMIDMVETKPQNEAPQDAKPPEDAPLLSVTGISFGAHTLAFAPARGRSPMPRNAVRLELFYALTDDHQDAPLSRARYWRSFNTSPIRIEFQPEADKKTATYYARWANENGDVGPWSMPASKTIAV